MKNSVLTVITSVVLIGAPAWAQIMPVPAENVADACPGDLNGDEVVDSGDLAAILGSYGICKDCAEDLNHDGYVDETDVKILATFWGPCVSDNDGTTKPSPSPADVSDDPAIYASDVVGAIVTNDNVFSDEAQAACAGDLDGNGQIDSKDLAVLLSKFGRCRGCEEDLNGDGFVDQEDMDILFDNWGMCSVKEEEITHLSRSVAAAGGDEIEEDLPPQNEPAEEEPQCPGDLDGNGTIDSTDLAILLGRYGGCKGCDADLSGDGYVDQKDIDMLLASWGNCAVETPDSSSPKGTSSPESLIGG